MTYLEVLLVPPLLAQETHDNFGIQIGNRFFHPAGHLFQRSQANLPIGVGEIRSILRRYQLRRKRLCILWCVLVLERIQDTRRRGGTALCGFSSRCSGGWRKFLGCRCRSRGTITSGSGGFLGLRESLNTKPTTRMLELHTIKRAGGFLRGLFSVGVKTSSSLGVAGRSVVGGCFGGGIFFFGGSLTAGGAAGLGVGPEPILAFTFALSNASLTFAFLTSARPSIKAFRGRSPTIFIRVPRQTAASLRAPSNGSSSNDARASDSGLICAGGIGVAEEDKHLAMNFNVPSLT